MKGDSNCKALQTSSRTTPYSVGLAIRSRVRFSSMNMSHIFEHEMLGYPSEGINRETLNRDQDPYETPIFSCKRPQLKTLLTRHCSLAESTIANKAMALGTSLTLPTYRCKACCEGLRIGLSGNSSGMSEQGLGITDLGFRDGLFREWDLARACS